jgi:integrase
MRNALTAVEVRSLKPDDKRRRIFDGGGLCLEVHPNGAKYWRQEYRFRGKKKLLAHGVFPRVTLAMARERREEALAHLAKGVDPGAIKAAAKHGSTSELPTFARAASEWLASPQAPPASTRERHAHALNRRLLPALGHKPIAEVSARDIFDVLMVSANEGKHETARKTKITASQVMRYAALRGWAATDPTFALRGALPAYEPRHHPHLEGDEAIGGLARSIRAYPSLLPHTRHALELLLLTFVRPGELCGATWEEFDLDSDSPSWRIPAARMKKRRQHLVPLAPQAIALLRPMQALESRGVLFPGLRRPSQPMTTAALNAALARMGYPPTKLVPHGFRGTASTWLNEHGERVDVIEKQLAHAEPNAVRAAYNHADYWPERRAMMHRWADALDRMRDSKAGEA